MARDEHQFPLPQIDVAFLVPNSILNKDFWNITLTCDMALKCSIIRIKKTQHVTSACISSDVVYPKKIEFGPFPIKDFCVMNMCCNVLKRLVNKTWTDVSGPSIALIAHSKRHDTRSTTIGAVERLFVNYVISTGHIVGSGVRL